MTRTLVATMASYHNFGSRKENLNQVFTLIKRTTLQEEEMHSFKVYIFLSLFYLYIM